MCLCMSRAAGSPARPDSTRAIHLDCSSYCANGTTFHGRPTKEIVGAWSGGKMCWYRCSTLQSIRWMSAIA